jgi:hypothetical protein
MALSDYEPARAQVEFKGGSFFVRGLALDDVTALMKSFSSDLEGMIGIYARGVNNDQTVAAMTQYAIALAKEAPGLVANVIARASDEPDAVDNARRLSMATQVQALKEIGRLTFEEAGGPKKFFESLNGLLTMVAPTATKTGSPI